jgi:hypothetical protein
MTDFKHVEEMIAKLPKGCCWLKKDVGGSHHDDPCPACREKRAAADTMQALLDENRLLRVEHHAGQYISRNSPDHTWEKWVDACDAADAKLQEQNDD